MTTYLRSRSPRGAVYFLIVEASPRYSLDRATGRWFRTCVVEFPDGRREVRGVLAEVADEAVAA